MRAATSAGHRSAGRPVASLAEQITLLSDLADQARALTDPPAWDRFRQGPWPTPHDTIFDFTRTPEGYEWLDHLAAAAAHRASALAAPVVIGHSDWYVGNLRFAADTVVAAYDWDSVVAEPEPVIAGFAAGSFTLGNATGPGAPTPEEVGTFLTEYAEHRPGSFTAAGRAAAAAAAVWVLAYNARCQLCFLPTGDPPPPGSTLQALAEHGQTYLTLDWLSPTGPHDPSGRRPVAPPSRPGAGPARKEPEQVSAIRVSDVFSA